MKYTWVMTSSISVLEGLVWEFSASLLGESEVLAYFLNIFYAEKITKITRAPTISSVAVVTVL